MAPVLLLPEVVTTVVVTATAVVEVVDAVSLVVVELVVDCGAIESGAIDVVFAIDHETRGSES
jgi:hypothetical protein